MLARGSVMEFLLTILFPLILLAAAWNCARADSWAERFVQWVAFAMVGLGIFAVAALVYFQLTSLGGAPQPQSGTAPSSLGQSWLGILSPLVALLAGGLGGAVFSYRVYLLPKERAARLCTCFERRCVCRLLKKPGLSTRSIRVVSPHLRWLAKLCSAGRPPSTRTSRLAQTAATCARSKFAVCSTSRAGAALRMILSMAVLISAERGSSGTVSPRMIEVAILD